MGGRLCTVCTSPDRAEIEAAILRGDSMRAIARRYAPSRRSMERHRDAHMGVAVAVALGARGDAERANGESILEQVRGIQARTLAILEAAGDDPSMGLKAIAEARRNLELCARLTGELDTRQRVDVEVRGVLAHLDLALLSDEEITRLLGGEPPRAVIPWAFNGGRR